MRLKIVTYNIKSGLYHPEGLEAVAQVLEGIAPQLIALQEVDQGTRRARHEDQTAWLARRLEMPYHCFGAATPWEGGGEYGVALISAFPLQHAGVTHLWVPQGAGVTHGEREPRVVLSAVIDLSQGAGNAAGGRITVMVTHLGLSEEQRVRQAKQLLELIRGTGSSAADPSGAGSSGAGSSAAILAGDLNGVPDSPELRILTGELHDVLGKVPESERVTFPSGDPEMHGHDFLARAIDYIFVNDGLEVDSARIVADYSLASDHNPCEALLLLTGR